jgi:adenine deaminase
MKHYAKLVHLCMNIAAQYVDLRQRRIYPVILTLENGKIQHIEPTEQVPAGSGYLLPGFVDAHVHIESSMLPPAEFARMAVVHGTVATVSDPHEIANVLGMEGVQFMLNNAALTPLKCCFGAPSCVPATTFETAGAHLNAEAVAELLAWPDIGYLSEMMNFPGVLHRDPEVMAKIEAAKALHKPIDGHAPALCGEQARQYFATGISTDHECFTLDEAREKAQLGVKILIREGSAARNFEALWPLIGEYPEQVMFCSDDKHPDDLVQGHINQLVARAIAKGCDLFDTLKAACVHPVTHYSLPVGQLQVGDPADFVVVRDLSQFEVLATYINGALVAENGKTLLSPVAVSTPNHFTANLAQSIDFQLIKNDAVKTARVIEVYDGEIVTGERSMTLREENDVYVSDPAQDLLKIVVLNRYEQGAKSAIGWVTGTQLRSGALASSVAHDSHNIVAIGCSDEALAAAINAIIEAKGGISAVNQHGEMRCLPLPIAGLMSTYDGWALADNYARLDQWVKTELSCPLRAPFMTLSFLALPVIPALKMTDRGLFDVLRFEYA